MRLRTLMLIGVGTLALTGCGLRGDLQRPAPMWGDGEAVPMDPDQEAPEDPNAPMPINPS
ncbi:LPS translocon maturation chaperone LptM [Brevundimonas aveniformis]|uniref:LPS translocon maturation chaperone LptM n=1 Tax=Brevundimonas aveniformis TaxID=370977 RepID=UPI0004064A50|nr:lipoprotein [Brevundimonas aveniformis]